MSVSRFEISWFRMQTNGYNLHLQWTYCSYLELTSPKLECLQGNYYATLEMISPKQTLNWWIPKDSYKVVIDLGAETFSAFAFDMVLQHSITRGWAGWDEMWHFQLGCLHQATNRKFKKDFEDNFSWILTMTIVHHISREHDDHYSDNAWT